MRRGPRARAGMSVALCRCVMRLSELTIIYFATAAPFGVASFLRQPTRGTSRAHSLARAAGAALLWPLTASLLLLERGASNGAGRGETSAREDLDEVRIEQAQRELTNALRAAEDVLDEACDGQEAGAGRDTRGTARRHAMFAARESVERYVGLTLACTGAQKEASPSAREMELCRLAGGAARPAARRSLPSQTNVTRLFAHRDRARAELIHALAGVREVADTFPFAEEIRASIQRRISEMLLRAFARAVELLSLLEDEGAARRVACLLDAECARLRRLEAEEADEAPGGGCKGAAVCTTPAAHRAFATPLLRTTTSGRG